MVVRNKDSFCFSYWAALQREPLATLKGMQAKRMLAKKKAAASKKSSASSSASLAAKEAKERAAKKAKLKDKKNYNQVFHRWVSSTLAMDLSERLPIPLQS